MARVVNITKACAVNPLKLSQPLGAALAFLGLDRCLPTLHGSQGCTSFGLVLLVRHFREMIPLQTTAMSEVSTILGGMDNIEQALLNIWRRAHPQVVGLVTTGLTETKGDDVEGSLRLIRDRNPELAEMSIVFVPAPDYLGSFQDGWSNAVVRIVQEFATPCTVKQQRRINVLAGSHLTPGDLEELRELIESFALIPVFLPDLSLSLDGHIPDDFTPTTLGGTTVEQLRSLGSASATLALGEQMHAAAIELEIRTGVPYVVLDRVTGLEPSDRLIQQLAAWSGQPVREKYRRQRSQLLDALLDAHFFTGGRSVALGAEPDMLANLSHFLADLGCEIRCAVTTTQSPVLECLPLEEVRLGDLEDLELGAAGCDLIITHSHGRQLAQRLNLPLLRMGVPTFDRLGAAHRVSVGYRGTRNLVFELGNLFIANSTDDSVNHSGRMR